MKRLMTFVAVLTLSATTALTLAKGATGGKGGGPSGVMGTVSQIGNTGFAMTTDKDSKTYLVHCDRMTKFMAEGKQVAPSTLKQGVHVRVEGGTLNIGELMATTVNIEGEKAAK